MSGPGKLLATLPLSGGSGSHPRAKEVECLNCGSRFLAGTRRPEFCGTPCIKSWNNRRMVRGAELYDLMMILRFEREEAYQKKVWSAMTRLARRYRDEDLAERNGRRSWRRLRSIIETRLALFSTVLVKRGRR